MKRFILAILCIVGIAFTGKAQEINDNALGLRFGGGNGFGAEFSYQYHILNNNRLELDLGLRSNRDFNSVKVTGLYQWVWNLEGNFNWYAGAGAGLGSVSDRRAKKDSDGVYALVAGNIGVEYLFEEVPLQLFLDFRPEIVLASYDVYNNFGPDFAIGIRYVF